MTEKNNNKKSKGFSLVDFGFGIILKVILSPLVVFVLGYFYFDRDVRKGLLVSLIYFSVFTLFSLFFKFLGIFTSAMSFNMIKLIKKVLDVIIMIITLVVYWLIYSLWFGANFTL